MTFIIVPSFSSSDDISKTKLLISILKSSVFVVGTHPGTNPVHDFKVKKYFRSPTGPVSTRSFQYLTLLVSLFHPVHLSPLRTSRPVSEGLLSYRVGLVSWVRDGCPSPTPSTPDSGASPRAVRTPDVPVTLGDLMRT